MWSAHDAQNWVLWIIDCPLWAHINHAGLVQWIDSNWAQRKLVICRKNLKCRCCPRGLRLCIFHALAHLYRKVERPLFFWGSDRFFSPLQTDCWIHLFGSFRSSSKKAAENIGLSMLSWTFSWTFHDLWWELVCHWFDNQFGFGPQKNDNRSFVPTISSQLNPSPTSSWITMSPQLFTGCLREPLNPQ